MTKSNARFLKSKALAEYHTGFNHSSVCHLEKGVQVSRTDVTTNNACAIHAGQVLLSLEAAQSIAMTSDFPSCFTLG